MSAQLKWFIPDRIALAIYRRIVSPEEIRQLDRQLVTWLNQSDLPVHVIADFRDFNHSTVDINTLRHLGVLSHPRTASMIVLGLNHPVLVTFGNVVLRMSDLDFRFTDSLEESIRYLAYIDPDLPDMTSSRYTVV